MTFWDFAHEHTFATLIVTAFLCWTVVDVCDAFTRGRPR